MPWRLRQRPPVRRPRWPPWLVLGRCLLLASEAHIVVALLLLFGRHLVRRGEVLQWVALARVALQDAILLATLLVVAVLLVCWATSPFGSQVLDRGGRAALVFGGCVLVALAWFVLVKVAELHELELVCVFPPESFLCHLDPGPVRGFSTSLLWVPVGVSAVLWRTVRRPSTMLPWLVLGLERADGAAYAWWELRELLLGSLLWLWGAAWLGSAALAALAVCRGARWAHVMGGGGSGALYRWVSHFSVAIVLSVVVVLAYLLSTEPLTVLWGFLARSLGRPPWRTGAGEERPLSPEGRLAQVFSLWFLLRRLYLEADRRRARRAALGLVALQVQAAVAQPFQAELSEDFVDACARLLGSSQRDLESQQGGLPDGEVPKARGVAVHAARRRWDAYTRRGDPTRGEAPAAPARAAAAAAPSPAAAPGAEPGAPRGRAGPFAWPPGGGTRENGQAGSIAQRRLAFNMLRTGTREKRQALVAARRHMLREQAAGDAALPSRLRVSVSRPRLLEDSLRVLLESPVAELLAPALSVAYRGEQGVDAGGVSRDWFDSVARALAGAAGPLAAAAEGSLAAGRSAGGDLEARLRAARALVATGRFLALAVLHGRPLPVTLGGALLKHLLLERIAPEDVRELDPDFFRFRVLEVLRSGGVPALEEALGERLVFTAAATEPGGGLEELLPGGAQCPVTEENKAEYVRLLCEARVCAGARVQTRGLLEGFWDLLPLRLLREHRVTPQELSVLISGDSIGPDPHEWQQHSRGCADTEIQEVVDWFWEAVGGELTAEQRGLLLRFATGSSRPPLGGFAELRPPFSVEVSRLGSAEHLPQAHTCINKIVLHRYASKAQLVEKLLMAVNGADGFSTA